eukprot:gene26543-9192_t
MDAAAAVPAAAAARRVHAHVVAPPALAQQELSDQLDAERRAASSPTTLAGELLALKHGSAALRRRTALHRREQREKRVPTPCRDSWRGSTFLALRRTEDQGRRGAGHEEDGEREALWRRFREFRYVPRYVEKRLAEAGAVQYV